MLKEKKEESCNNALRRHFNWGHILQLVWIFAGGIFMLLVPTIMISFLLPFGALLFGINIILIDRGRGRI
jgi:hypothetical protein